MQRYVAWFDGHDPSKASRVCNMVTKHFLAAIVLVSPSPTEWIIEMNCDFCASHAKRAHLSSLADSMQ